VVSGSHLAQIFPFYDLLKSGEGLPALLVRQHPRCSAVTLYSLIRPCFRCEIAEENRLAPGRYLTIRHRGCRGRQPAEQLIPRVVPGIVYGSEAVGISTDPGSGHS